MVGITSYGAYIPWHRLDRTSFVRAWGWPTTWAVNPTPPTVSVASPEVVTAAGSPVYSV